jgi:hypothetical protein
MDDKKLKVVTYAVLCISTLGVIGFVTYTSGGFDVLSNGFLFVLWAVSPYILLGTVSFRAMSHRTVLTSSVLSVLCMASVYMYFDSLFIHPDAQGALVFLFLPLYQLFAICFGFGISAMVKLIQKR